MGVKEGRPRVSERPGFCDGLRTVLERVSMGEISKQEAARILRIGNATLYKYAGWTRSEMGIDSLKGEM